MDVCDNLSVFLFIECLQENHYQLLLIALRFLAPASGVLFVFFSPLLGFLFYAASPAVKFIWLSIRLPVHGSLARAAVGPAVCGRKEYLRRR